MKVEAIRNYNNRVYEINIGNKNNKQVNQGYAQINQLPNYESVSSKFPLNVTGFSGNFMGRSSDEINQEYLKQIKNAENELKALRSSGSSSAVQTAIEENNFYDDFQRYRSYYSDTASRNADKAEERWRDAHGWWYRVRHQSELSNLRHEEWKSYYNRSDRANEIEPRYYTNKALIESDNENAETREKRIKELEALIDKLKKLIDYAGLRQSIDDALSGHGGLNDRIAGYDGIKNKARKFIESLSASKDNEDAYVSPCFILYGATGTGKTTVLHAIEHMASDDVEIIRFDNDDKTSFMRRFRNACKDAQNRYRETGKRTILLMDDAEKYFCMPTAEAESYYLNELDKSDLDKLRTINENGTNQDVKDFKAILDVLSQVPKEDEGDSYKSAMSIFITTNHPHLIDRQLIKRPEKMDAYHVGPAAGRDLNEVVKFYFKDKEKIINELKMFKDRPDMESAIDCLANLDIDAKTSIKNYFRAEKADMLKINPYEVDYDTMTEDYQPSLEEGAFSNVMIKRIAFRAFERYLQNPEEPYQVYFYDELQNASRDIEPQRYKRYLETADFVNLFKQSEQIKDIKDRYEFAKMLDKRNKNLISKSDSKSLESFLQKMSTRLGALREKQESGTLSENECIEFEDLLEQEKLNNDSNFLKEYLKTNKH